jgi:glycosyltransferase involved in cell wall biosynthesis
MRIAYFSETFMPRVDGITVAIRHYLDRLHEAGHESVMFTPVYKGLPKRYKSTNVISRPSLGAPGYDDLKVAWPWTHVRKDLERFKPDVVHLVNPAFIGLAGMRAARRLKLPTVATYYTDIPGFAVRYGMGLFYRPLYTYFRWLHNNCDINLAPSAFTRDELQRHGFQRLQVLGAGVDNEQFNPIKRTNDWRERLSAGEPDKPLLIWISRLAPEKRPDMLLDVVRAIPGLRLAIVGDGPDRRPLERKFAGTPTVFTGYLKGEDLAHAYAAGDVFIHTGSNETFGNVVIEAMASGLPVVAPNSGGLLDFVEDGVNGLLYQADDSRSLVETVRRLVEDEALAIRLGLHGRATAEQHGWDQVVKSLLETYQKAIADKRRPDAELAGKLAVSKESAGN